MELNSAKKIFTAIHNILG